MTFHCPACEIDWDVDESCPEPGCDEQEPGNVFTLGLTMPSRIPWRSTGDDQ